MKFKEILTIIVPSTFAWMLASLLLLIYSFDIIEYVNSLANNPFTGLGMLLVALILCLIILTMYFTGMFLDTHPDYLRFTTMIGMIGSSFSIIIFALTLNESLLLIISLMALSFFFGILLTSSGTLFAGLTTMWKRGQIYSLAIALFIFLTLLSIVLGGFISHSFPENELFSHSWAIILPLVGIEGLVLALIFLLLTMNLGVPWINDRWPTKFEKIIGRRSVRAYLVTHVLLYTMVGITITAFSKLGGIFNVDLSVIIPTIGQFDLPPDKTFWFVVLLGDLITVIPAGYLTDKFGRKNLIVLTIYGIVFSTLIFGLEQSFESYLASALVLGFSFALLHPTLDSSLWADLSPRDGLGRYYALGFISLALGLGVGSGIGQWILVPTTNNIELLTYLLIILAISAAFPLFWVSDSFEPLDFNLLLVMEEGGLPIFDYMFQKKIEFSVELTLLSGALTAVASFMSETMKEKGDLNLVQHGRHFILTEKKGGVSAAIFSNKQDPELQRALKEFLEKFCDIYSETLKTWNGTRSLFDGAVDIAEEVFGHLAPSTDL